MQMANNFVSVIGLVVRRELVGDALHFAEDLPTYEDYECYSRLAKTGLCAFLACETAWQHGHSSPRLTNASVIERTRARIAVLNRVWGVDREYLAQHGGEFHAVLAEQRQILFRALLGQGRVQEARELLRDGAEAPFLWKALARMSPTLLQTAARARWAVQRRLHAG
jgi:hypothetical protein